MVDSIDCSLVDITVREIIQDQVTITFLGNVKTKMSIG